MKLEFITRSKHWEHADEVWAVTVQTSQVKDQIIAAQNWARLDVYLKYADQQLRILEKVGSWVSKEDFSNDVIRIFSELFQKWFSYHNYEKREILSKFQFAHELYHQFFPEMKWQNFFNGETRAKLMNLSDSWVIQYTSPGQWYMFI